jgi:hypothetical protein
MKGLPLIKVPQFLHRFHEDELDLPKQWIRQSDISIPN